MKKLKVTDPKACQYCLACVNACSEAFYKVADPDLSCIQMGQKKGEWQPIVCPQCGKCAKVCESGAITQNAKGVYMINKKKCTGCGKCKDACPFHVLVKASDEAPASKCIACGICAKACPMGILEIVEN